MTNQTIAHGILDGIGLVLTFATVFGPLRYAKEFRQFAVFTFVMAVLWILFSIAGSQYDYLIYQRFTAGSYLASGFMAWILGLLVLAIRAGIRKFLRARRPPLNK